MAGTGRTDTALRDTVTEGPLREMRPGSIGQNLLADLVDDTTTTYKDCGSLGV